MRRKTANKKHEEFRKMLHHWLETDMVRAGFVYDKVEKRNEAFARGWRLAIYSVTQQLDNYDL